VLPVLEGQCGGDGGAIDARQGFQDESGNRHQGAGIAGGNAGIGFAALDQIGGHTHRGIFLGAQRHGRGSSIFTTSLA
jgi:hypothetical protein